MLQARGQRGQGFPPSDRSRARADRVFVNPILTKIYLSLAHDEAPIDRFVDALDAAASQVNVCSIVIAIVLALGASLLWGLTNFVGGMQARQLALLTMLLISQPVGVFTIVVVVVVRGDGPPGTEAIATAAAGGVVSALALAVLFRALTIGKFNVVMPIISASAVVPVVVGVARGERPSSLQLIGIVAVILGVAVAARRADAEKRGSSRGLAGGVALAFLSIALIGTVLVALDRAASDDPYWAVLILRAAALSVLVFAALALAHVPRAPRANVRLYP